MRSLTPLILTVLGCLVVSAAEQTKQVTITTRPRLHDRGQLTYLVLTDDKHSYELAWSKPPTVQLFPVSLEPNRFYTFTVAEEPYMTLPFPKLRRVQQDGQTIYDIEVCEVHKTKMEHKEVIPSGLILPGPGAPSPDVERQIFPHRLEALSYPTAQTTQRVYVCTDCKKVYEKWKTENRKTK